MVKEGARRRADVPFLRERGCGQRAWVLWGVRRTRKVKRVREWKEGVSVGIEGWRRVKRIVSRVNS